MNAKVYCHENVRKVYQLHQKAIEGTTINTTVLQQLTAFSDTLFTAWRNRNPVCKGQINNWHPDYIGQSLDFIFKADFTLADARLAIAKDCGFQNWQVVKNQRHTTFNSAFETAVDTLLAGKIDNLKKQVTTMPALLTMRSVYGHQATLLHYAGSNGVEMWRQKTPYNLPEIVQFLIEEGADKGATMAVYGGHYTTWEMVATSAHPHEAGLVEELKNILN